MSRSLPKNFGSFHVSTSRPAAVGGFAARKLRTRVRWVLFLQQVPEKIMKRGLFCCVTGAAEAFFVALGAMAGEAMVLRMEVAGPGCSAASSMRFKPEGGLIMLKILTATAASLAMLGAAAAADLPRKEPPPPVAPVGKAPIGKYPVGKFPVGKYPAPVVTKG
jgi:hypothetical protein